MPNDRMMLAIGRIEHALARLERVDFGNTPPASSDNDLTARHDALKRQTKAAVADIDSLLNRIGS